MAVKILARDIMVKNFLTIHPEATVTDAIKLLLDQEVRETGHKALGIVVAEDKGGPLGMLSMYDVIYHLTPAFMAYMEENPFDDLIEGELELYIERAKDLKVKDMMNAPLITVKEDAHVLTIMNIMVKRRIRRLPVVQEGHLVGMIYLSDVFRVLSNLIIEK